MMNALCGKKILLAITGGIAAYKSAELCRELKKRGAEVRVVMTQGAQEFITPLTLQALSGNPVHTQLLDPEAELGMGHIELAKWPDCLIVAPATANFIAKYAHGFADDLLSTLLLASEAPVLLAPAMNQAMWRNPLTQRNIKQLTHLFGESIRVLGPAAGEQACGDVGPGRMLEPMEIRDQLNAFFCSDELNTEATLAGKTVVITAGPTQEPLDPVRYISNHSSGKMGYALAEQFKAHGADVVLVSGPTNIPFPQGVDVRPVVTAEQMLDAVEDALQSKVDIFVACAAVADYRAKNIADKKMKKKSHEGDAMVIHLEQNPDIVATVAARDGKPFTVGFAAETNDVLSYARGKLKSKNLDMIIANDVSDSAIGFNSDENSVHVITASEEKAFAQESKKQLAAKLVREISACYASSR